MKINLSNKWFDILKWVALILLPAMAILYGALAPLWGFPFVKEVVGTISAIDVFLGVLLGISSAQYKKEFGVLPRKETDVSWMLWDGTYDKLMWVAQVFLPGLSAFYFALALIWNLPEPEKVVATIMAIDTCLGMLLGLSSAQFNKTLSQE